MGLAVRPGRRGAVKGVIVVIVETVEGVPLGALRGLQRKKKATHARDGDGWGMW